jgi:hypothetical protein
MANIELVLPIHFHDFVLFPSQIITTTVLHNYESSHDRDGTGIHSGSLYDDLHHQIISS